MISAENFGEGPSIETSESEAAVPGQQNVVAEMPADLVEVVRLTFKTNGRDAGVEMYLPQGGDLDERNPMHVFAWFICSKYEQLLPEAITAWYAERSAMLHKTRGAVAGDEPAPELARVASAILGADAKPIKH